MSSKTPLVAALAVASLLTSTANAVAQVGVVAGVAQSTIAFGPQSGSPEPTGIQRRSGVAVGLSLLMPANRAGGWQIEALLIQKGAQNLLRRDDALRLTYVEIPLLMHVDFARRHRIAAFLLAGPSLAFPVRATYEDDGVQEDIRDEVSNVDVGLHLGVGVEIGPATLDARYLWGGRTVFHERDFDGTFKNRAFTLMAGIRFGR